MKTVKYIIVYLFCLVASSFAQTTIGGGILFSGNKDVPVEKRTFINFTPENPINLKDKFTIGFDLAVWNKGTYGRIFRARDEKGFSIWLYYAFHLNKDTSYLMLSINKSAAPVKIPLPKNELVRNNWFRIDLTFDLAHNRIMAWKNGIQVSGGAFNLPEELNLSLSSGSAMEDLDAPGIALANFTVKDRLNYTIHLWKLDEVSGTRAFDSAGGIHAGVLNGQWLAPGHTKWTKAAEFSFAKIDSYGITYDSRGERILFFDNDFYGAYDIGKEKLEKYYYSNKRPFLVNHAVYNPYNNKIYAYYKGQGQVSEFNEEKRTWSKADSCKYADEHYYGHTSFFNPLNGDLLMFGGYGWFKFSNELRKYNFKSRRWEALKLKGDFIAPRFRSIVTPYKNKGEFLIIGGTGTNSAHQEEGVKQYYDLYLLNMKDTSLKKIGELKGESKTYEVMNYAWFDQSHAVYFPVFHAAGRKLSLNLYRLDLNNLVVSDEGAITQGITTLEGDYYFLKSSTNELYVIHDVNKGRDSMKTVIYKTSWPPLKYELLASVQSDNEKKLDRNKYLSYLGAGILLLISFAAGFVQVKKRWTGKKGNPGSAAEKSANMPSRQKRHYSIILFGEFSILDRESNEITNELGPKLREMLQLIILNMKFQGGAASGISSEKLTLTLWPDSDQQRAKNNRNSSMAKLRAFLHRIEGADIEFTENGWIFTSPNENECDYLRYLSLKNNSVAELNDGMLQMYLEIISNGSLLSNVSYEWLDPVKASVEKEVIENSFSLASALVNSHEAVVKIMDIILKWDPINEKALRLKIENLVKSGGYGEARTAYELFRSEYRKIFDNEYTTPFKDLAG